MGRILTIGCLGILAILVIVLIATIAAMPKSTPQQASATSIAAPAAAGTVQPRPTSAPATASPEPQPTVKVEGKGIMNSAPFDLKGGQYLVRWTANPESPVGCFHGSDLVPVSGRGRTETIANAMVKADPQSGETRFYNVTPGQYYVRANSGCQWSVTLEAVS